jgi:hypothetical protein
MAALRQHGDGLPARGLFTTVCAHASWLPTRRAGQTTSSLVSHLTVDEQTHYVTGTAAPCTSLFKPVWLDSGLGGYGPPPGERFDARALWWRHERLHRRALGDLPGFLARYAAERDRLESEILDDSSGSRAEHSERAFERADAFEQSWLERLEPPATRSAHALYWRLLDGRSGMTA